MYGVFHPQRSEKIRCLVVWCGVARNLLEPHARTSSQRMKSMFNQYIGYLL